MSFIHGMKIMGILLSVSFLTSCVVGGQVFFTNDSAVKYSQCFNASLHYDAVGEQMLECYSDVKPDGSCDRNSYNYFRCKSLLKRYSECQDEHKLRDAYVERCMNE